ncbi:protein kinase [candidate division GN15 bacterium]|nr:protein kinase [candidate division GN15 bacterium]
MNKYSSQILYLLISILVVILYANNFGVLESWQRSLDDYLLGITSSDETRENIALVKIDPYAEDELGPWPWDYDRVADLLAAIGGAEPKAIVVNFPIPEDAHQDSAGYTKILAQQLSWIPNLVVPYDIALATFRTRKASNPDHLFNYSVGVNDALGIMDEESSLLARKVFLPAEKVLKADVALGFEYTVPDDDRVLRHQPLVMNYDGYYYPSLELLGAALFLNIPPDQIVVTEGERIDLGHEIEIPINGKCEYFVSWSPAEAFVNYSAGTLLTDKEFDFSQLKDKLVVVGPDDFTITGEVFKTPQSPETSKLAVKANVIENFINNSIVTVFHNPLVDMLILFALGGMFAFVLPQLKVKQRLLIVGGTLVAMVAANVIIVAYTATLITSVYLFAQLVLTMIASPLVDSALIHGEKPTATPKKKTGEAAVAETDKTADKTKPLPATSKPAAKSEHQVPNEHIPEPEPAIEDHQALTLDDPDAATVANATPEFQDSSALETAIDNSALDAPISSGPEIIGPGEDTADSPESIATDPGEISLDEPPVGGSDESDSVAVTDDEPDIFDSAAIKLDEPEDFGLSDSDAAVAVTPEDELPAATTDSGQLQPSDSGGIPQIKSLGRYQINGTLGKGAMGHVYKGIDPAINRPVALKTIRLDFVNDPDEMAELKERLFREAQAAGKLSHPNIVTIYDVGSEGHLQYIAMEYLEGRTLEDMIKRKVKFNYKIIAQIITQICSALEYAHERKIVHRDIKPANIMILENYLVKVMDYGIARVDSNSMTKTGIAMGTPNYISPEQLKGAEIDQRADLFSLGVVMYEMLLGRRPFRGENLTSLIYAIINNEPEKPSDVNPDLPLLFDHVISKALKKNPSERFQRASEIKNALSDFVESFAS